MQEVIWNMITLLDIVEFAKCIGAATVVLGGAYLAGGIIE
jgi:hypothetical protein